jgi:DNA repair protein REV1
VKKLALHQLQSKLGAKMGQTLFNFSRGIDDRPLLTNQQRQSVSAEVNVSWWDFINK